MGFPSGETEDREPNRSSTSGTRGVSMRIGFVLFVCLFVFFYRVSSGWQPVWPFGRSRMEFFLREFLFRFRLPCLRRAAGRPWNGQPVDPRSDQGGCQRPCQSPASQSPAHPGGAFSFAFTQKQKPRKNKQTNKKKTRLGSEESVSFGRKDGQHRERERERGRRRRRTRWHPKGNDVLDAVFFPPFFSNKVPAPDAFRFAVVFRSLAASHCVSWVGRVFRRSSFVFHLLRPAIIRQKKTKTKQKPTRVLRPSPSWCVVRFLFFLRFHFAVFFFLLETPLGYRCHYGLSYCSSCFCFSGRFSFTFYFGFQAEMMIDLCCTGFSRRWSFRRLLAFRWPSRLKKKKRK